MTAGKSASTKPGRQSSDLLAELERRAGHDPVLKYLLQQEARPTADDYISMQWDELPDDMDEEEREIIRLLQGLEAESQ
jgi:hypothetical protein